MRKLVLTFVAIAIAGICNGCGGGQTKPDDANSQQHRCGPQTRCGPVNDEDLPPKTSQKVVVPERSDHVLD
jgi:hypothetical protein